MRFDCTFSPVVRLAPHILATRLNVSLAIIVFCYTEGCGCVSFKLILRGFEEYCGAQALANVALRVSQEAPKYSLHSVSYTHLTLPTKRIV